MNWMLFAGDDLIYDRDFISDDGKRPFEVFEPKMHETTNGFGSITFKANDGSAAVSYAQNMFPLIKAYNDGVLYWTGRVLSRTPNILGEYDFYIEDFLSVLNDSVCRPFNFHGTPSAFLQMLIESHNSQVPPWQQFSAVNCNVNSQFQTGDITRSSESYSKTWAIIKDRLIDSLGGHMWVSYDANENPVLNYSTSPRDTATQTIELSENLAELSIKTSGAKFYTACVPLGKQDDETKEYLTVKSVNNGDDFIINEIASQNYGIIFAPIEETTWPDITTPANLYANAIHWMQYQSAKTIQEISLTAYDTGEGEPFYWLDNVHVIVPTRGLDAQFMIEELTRQLDKPRVVDITLNITGSNLASLSASTAASNARVIKEIISDYTTSGDVVAISEQTIRNSTWIQQEANRIVAGALEEFVETGDFARLEQSVQSQFSILANEISIEFTSLSNMITTQGNDIQSTLDQYASWFRFLSYGLVIGRSNSPVQMVLKNDVLYFCTDPDTVTDQTAIAYFSSGKLYVNFINVNNLTIGTTGKWLDVRIVGSGDNICALFSGRLS